MGVKGRSNSLDLSKIEVGEIDTRAPFASVKVAVSLFEEVAYSGDSSSGRRTKQYSLTKAYSLSRTTTQEVTHLRVASCLLMSAIRFVIGISRPSWTSFKVKEHHEYLVWSLLMKDMFKVVLIVARIGIAAVMLATGYGIDVRPSYKRRWL